MTCSQIHGARHFPESSAAPEFSKNKTRKSPDGNDAVAAITLSEVHAAKRVSEFVVSSFVSGLVILTPIYLSILLLLKAMEAVAGVVRPIAKLLPEWFPAERVLSFLLVL